jgi:hypothetical protein
MDCVLCNGPILVGHPGHNAEPLAEGRCCAVCNFERVLPAKSEQRKGQQEPNRHKNGSHGARTA